MHHEVFISNKFRVVYKKYSYLPPSSILSSNIYPSLLSPTIHLLIHSKFISFNLHLSVHHQFLHPKQILYPPFHPTFIPNLFLHQKFIFIQYSSIHPHSFFNSTFILPSPTHSSIQHLSLQPTSFPPSHIYSTFISHLPNIHTLLQHPT